MNAVCWNSEVFGVTLTACFFFFYLIHLFVFENTSANPLFCVHFFQSLFFLNENRRRSTPLLFSLSLSLSLNKMYVLRKHPFLICSEFFLLLLFSQKYPTHQLTWNWPTRLRGAFNSPGSLEMRTTVPHRVRPHKYCSTCTICISTTLHSVAYKYLKNSSFQI